jgi:hypothetical protein
MGLLSKAVLITNPANSESVDSAESVASAESTDSAEAPLTRNLIKRRISEFHTRHAVFQGMVLELPWYPPIGDAPIGDSSVGDARQQLATMVSLLGMAIDLGAGRVLVLFPREIDRQLIAHRLAKSLGAVSPRSFEADSPEHALALLEPFIR